MPPQPSLPESRSRGFRHSSSYGHTVLCPNRKTYSSLRLLSLLPPGIFLLCGRQPQRPCRTSGLTASGVRSIMKKIPERKGMRMKENRKLLKEVLKDIQHDMTDEEVLNLLADSKISESPQRKNIRSGSVRRMRSQNLRAAGRSSFRLRVCCFCGWSSIRSWRQMRSIRSRLSC